MQITRNKFVQVDFQLSSTSGDVISSSSQDAPLDYVHGLGILLPALEEALEGRATGDALTVELEPQSAYGHRRDELVHRVPRSEFPADSEIEPGMGVTAQGPGGNLRMVVTEVEGDEVVLDGNHPLAGLTLVFQLEVRDVRDATDDEIAQASTLAG